MEHRDKNCLESLWSILSSRSCLSAFPEEIEHRIFLEAMADPTNHSPADLWQCLLVAKRVHHWLEPPLYRMVDIDSQKKAEHFASSLQSRPDFARTAVRVLRLRTTVSPEKGAEILWLCQGLRELTLQITVDRPDDQNPLRRPLNALHLVTSLSMNLSSGFYGPFIALPELRVLRHVKRLHLANGWVARCGRHIGLHLLHQLTHLSLLIHPLAEHEEIYSETLRYLLKTFPSLQIVVLWTSAYEENRELFNSLEMQSLRDYRVVTLDAKEFALLENDFWRIAESAVQQRRIPTNTSSPNLGVTQATIGPA